MGVFRACELLFLFLMLQNYSTFSVRPERFSNVKKGLYSSPFGCELKGRNLKKSGVNKSFRFGFNGMEADDEVKGDGNSYDFGARMLDPRLGRWLTIDALSSKYPYLSPYSSNGDNPLIYKDINGDYLDPANQDAQEFIDKTADKFAKAFTFEPYGKDESILTIKENFDSFKQFTKHLKKQAVTLTDAEQLDAYHFYQLVKEPKRIEVQIAITKTPDVNTTREFKEGNKGSNKGSKSIVTYNGSFNYFLKLLGDSKDGLTPDLAKYLYEGAAYTNRGETEEKTYTAEAMPNVQRGAGYTFFPEEDGANKSKNSGMLIIDGTNSDQTLSNLVNGVSSAQNIILK